MSSTVKSSVVIILFLTIVFGYAWCLKSETNIDYLLKCEVIPVEGGFGYKIFNGEKIMILQEYVPVLTGKQPFSNPSQALSAGNLVIWKLENGKSPILDISDIEKLNIPLTVP